MPASTPTLSDTPSPRYTIVPTSTPQPLDTRSPTPTATATITPVMVTPVTPTLTLTRSPSVLGNLVCQEPPNDYTRVKINGQVASRRTLWMLEQAQALYGGPGSILRVTQGSYTPGLKESFGTHDGGGAVDISILNPTNPKEVLWSEVPKMIAAMRRVGFAAWYRPAGMFGPNSSAHIHAIAVGDAELSPAARRQIDGPEGYLRGLDGVPPQYGGPHPDTQGGPIMCPWMINMGFKDLRP